MGLLAKSAAESLPAVAKHEPSELVGAGGCCLCYTEQQSTMRVTDEFRGRTFSGGGSGATAYGEAGRRVAAWATLPWRSELKCKAVIRNILKTLSADVFPFDMNPSHLARAQKCIVT